MVWEGRSLELPPIPIKVSACVKEVEVPSQCFGQCAAIDMRVAAELTDDDFNRLGLCKGSLDLALLMQSSVSNN